MLLCWWSMLHVPVEKNPRHFAVYPAYGHHENFGGTQAPRCPAARLGFPTFCKTRSRSVVSTQHMLHLTTWAYQQTSRQVSHASSEHVRASDPPRFYAGLANCHV